MNKEIAFPFLILLAASPLLSAGTSLATQAKTIFAPGVTHEKGWYDVNKKSTSNQPTKDFTYCWAASAANMIRWWQDCYTSSKNTLPESVPTGKTSALGYSCGIFDIFLDDNNWNNIVNGSPRGADQHVALKWYFNGDMHTYSGTYAVPIKGSGGYWKSEYAELQSLLGADFIQKGIEAYGTWGGGSESRERSCSEIFSEHVRTLLSAGAVGMSANTSLLGGHAITLWGADFDGLGIVTSVYITDSDDAAKTQTISGLRKYGVSYDTTKHEVYLSDTDYGSRNLITALYGLTAYPIPEPSAFGLLAGTLALGLVASRRRKKL